MRFIYLNGSIYCRWGEKEKEWFVVFDHTVHKDQWFP